MAVAAKVDLKKELKELYRPSPRQVSYVNVPALNFLMIDGKGDPNDSQRFQDAIGALYGVAYTLKFGLKKEGLEFSVMPLEGLWWTPGRKRLQTGVKDAWRWTLMIALPGQVKKSQVNKAIKELAGKKNPPALTDVRFERFGEGKAVQIMHVGPYAEEGPTIEKLHAWAKENGFKLVGKHHEIYMGDPRRSAPEKLKTIIRLPIEKK